MTLDGVIALILRFSPNSIALLANYVTTVEGGPIMSVNIACLFSGEQKSRQSTLSAIAMANFNA